MNTTILGASPRCGDRAFRGSAIAPSASADATHPYNPLRGRAGCSLLICALGAFYLRLQYEKGVIHLGAGFFISVMLLAVSCASAPSSASTSASLTPPEWVLDIRAVYSNSEYIAQQGTGKTKKEAELAALSAISLYFETETSTAMSGQKSLSDDNGVVSDSRRTSSNITVQSQARLIAVRYADDPWYDSAAKEWHSVASIKRGEAWTIYEPRAKKITDTFLTLYNAAEAEIDPFTRVLRFSAAAPYALNEEYDIVRNFAQILNPSKAQVLFAAPDAARAALPEKIITARRRATVYIDCKKDYSGLLYNAALSALSAEGFPVESDPYAASSVCAITVDEGERKGDTGVFFYPALSGTVSGESGAVFSFSAKTARQGAIDPELAKRRAYTALATALKESFVESFNKKRASLEQK